MKNKKKLSLAVLACLPLFLPAIGETASHRKIVYIDQYDQNLDGRVSSVEFELARRQRFDITDANQNGEVDAEEYVFEWEDRLDAQLDFDRKEQVMQTATRFGSLDDNEDALISWDEFEASGLWSFARFDSNEDGEINESDIDSMAEAIVESDSDMSREQILHDNKRMLVMPSTHSQQGTITQYDSNGDESATIAEFTAGRMAFFEAMDENSNGGVTQDEYLAEFENRVDNEISRFRKESIEQAYVRFNALDGDENGIMSFEEYQNSGHSSFKRWDTDANGFISLEEADPVEREFSQEQINSENQGA